VVKIHVHTNDPGLAIQKALKYGALSNMKIDNMRLEHQEKLFKMEENAQKQENIEEMPHKETGFIAVSVGDGINEIFKGLGVDYIIEGGQTMNPSTEDMLNAIDKVNADTIFILPNNKNIILAANQAKAMVEDKNIIVIPTRTVPQGITAVINYVPDMSVDDNAETMNGEISNVKTGQVTYAVRDTIIDDKEIKQGDYMGIGDKGILSVGADVDDVTFEMIKNMMDDSCELISIYYGSDIKEDAAEALKAKVEETYPSCDVELQFGGQPIYYYIVSAE
ncbi:MAG: DAK2 domain-containing protein, partial [Suilimivivens sp.]